MSVHPNEVVRELRLVARSMRGRAIQCPELHEIADRVDSVARTMGNAPQRTRTVYEQAVLGAKLCSAAKCCAPLDSHLAVDVWLVTADYYAHVLHYFGEAGAMLECAANHVGDDEMQRAHGLLSAASNLFERAHMFERASRIEETLAASSKNVDARERQARRRRAAALRQRCDSENTDSESWARDDNRQDLFVTDADDDNHIHEFQFHNSLIDLELDETEMFEY